MNAGAPWWAGTVGYEVYLPSFQDGNGDGWGDLPGLTSRLDYLHSLGVDLIWVTPFHPSPMKDHGYDVADYLSVDPASGRAVTCLPPPTSVTPRQPSIPALKTGRSYSTRITCPPGHRGRAASHSDRSKPS